MKLQKNQSKGRKRKKNELNIFLMFTIRTVVLDKLNNIVKEFVYRVSKLQGFSENTCKSAGGKIFTFGSYQLGVHGSGKIEFFYFLFFVSMSES